MGFQKTGSSAIQVCLAQNRKLLLKNNIIYPKNEKDLASEGKVSIGNARAVSYFFKKPWWKPKNIFFRYWLSQLLKNAHEKEKIIFSSEILFKDYRKSKLQLIKKICDSRKTSLECLFYIRSVIGFIYSHYNQWVKILGYDKDFSFFIRNDLKLPYEILLELKKAGIEPIVRNYDLIQKEYGSEHDFLFNYLKLSPKQIVPEKKMINRSLTNEEIDLMLELNKNEKIKEVSGAISDSLIKLNPSLSSTKKIKEEDYDYLTEKYSETVSKINENFEGLNLRLNDPNIKII